MNDTEYLKTQQQLGLLVSLLIETDTEGLLRRIERAEILGPLVDPTLYREAHESVSIIKATARVFDKAKKEITRLRERAAK